MRGDFLRTAGAWFEPGRDIGPAWAIGVGSLLLATGLALLAHYIFMRVVGRLIGVRRPFLAQLVARTSGPTRLGLIILALSLVLPFAPIEPSVASAVGHLLLIGFIILLGWFALIVVGLTSDVYLARFRLGASEDPRARKLLTQLGILQHATDILIIVVTAAAALMTFESVRQYGVSLFASAGVVSIVVGLAARPVLSNLIAGLQIALTQPLRLEDAVVVENEFGWIEEIAATYIVIRLWDRRRMIVPLSYFVEKPFQNWTRQSTEMIGSVVLYVDYAAPVARMREKLTEIVAQSALWDQQVANLQVTDAKEGTIQVQALVSAKSLGALNDLRAEVREKLIAFLQAEHPRALPRQRAEIELTQQRSGVMNAATVPAPREP